MGRLRATIIVVATATLVGTAFPGLTTNPAAPTKTPLAAGHGDSANSADPDNTADLVSCGVPSP